MSKQYIELKEKSSELSVQRKQMHKDFVQTKKDLNKIEHKFHKSQGKYQTMQTQRDELQQNMEFAEPCQQELQRRNQAKDKTVQQ